MTQKWDVLGFGAVAVDDLLYVDRFPEPDTKTAVRERHRDGGGLVGTALVAAARLGARTAYGGVLGGDDLSRYTLEQLQREGVDCSPVLQRKGARPFHSVIIVHRPSGRRSILATREGVTPFPPCRITEKLVARCRVLFVDHHGVEAACRAAELAHRHGIPVVADIERLDMDGILELIRRVDHLIVGLAVGRLLTGKRSPARIAPALQRLGPTVGTVTDGANGCWYSTGSSAAQHVPAFPVPVVDTTGCGDVFHGAYAACIAAGEPVSTAILVATAAAALKATRPGGRTGIPNRAGVNHFLAQRGFAPNS